MEPVRVLPLRELQPASTAAEHNPDSPPFLEREPFRIQPGIRQRLARRNDCKGCAARNMRAYLSLKVLVRIDAADFAGDLGGKWGRIKRRDPPDAALGVSKSLP